MKKGRKTIEVAKVLEMANSLLDILETEENKSIINQQFKSGVCSLLEDILNATDNYNGFNNNEWIKRGGYRLWIKDMNGDASHPTTEYLSGTYDRFYY